MRARSTEEKAAAAQTDDRQGPRPPPRETSTSGEVRGSSRRGVVWDEGAVGTEVVTRAKGASPAKAQGQVPPCLTCPTAVETSREASWSPRFPPSSPATGPGTGETPSTEGVRRDQDRVMQGGVEGVGKCERQRAYVGTGVHS